MKAPIISTELIPNHTMGEGGVLIIEYLGQFSYTEARQEVQDIPESTFREVPSQGRVPAASQASSDEWAP